MQPQASTIRAILYGFALAAFCIFAGVMMARAEGVGGNSYLPDIAPRKSEPWTGPYIAIGAGWAIATVSPSGENVGAYAEASQVHGIAGWDKQWGQFVGGLGLGYAHYFGELSDIDHDVSGFARLGLLVTPNSLVYGKLGYGQIKADGESVDGWRVGGGVEIRVPSSPMAIDLFYELGMHDSPIKGLDTDSHTIGARLVFRPFSK